MFFRMLAKDLKENIGLNITLFLFMVMGTACLATGICLIYANFGGEVSTYSTLNTSDVVLHINNRLDHPEYPEEIFTSLKDDFSDIAEVSKTPELNIYVANLSFVKGGVESFTKDTNYSYYLKKMKHDNRNIPVNLSDHMFTIPHGKIAVCQMMANAHSLKIGDCIRIKTQYGNIYQFEICDIFKDPSSYGAYKLYISDVDYEIIDSEWPEKSSQFEIYMKDMPHGAGYNYIREFTSILMEAFSDFRVSIIPGRTIILSNEGIISVVVSICSLLIGIFISIMNLVTIKFSLKSALKREEKEIGMMKAMGINSLSYRLLFCAKYIAFAITGGIFGLMLSLYINPIAIRIFCVNILSPEIGMEIFFASLSSVIFITTVIFFTLSVLRHMQKISVMDALHGENRGERFNSFSSISLFKRRHMNVPFFLAMHDILIKIKRYSSLIIAYSLGFYLILLGIRLRDSVCDGSYMSKYFFARNTDFYFDVGEQYEFTMIQKYGSYPNFIKELNLYLNEQGIPVDIENFDVQFDSKVIIDDRESGVILHLPGNVNLDGLTYRKGGYVPTLENEIAVPFSFAKERKLNIGDKVRIKYYRFQEDAMTAELVEEDFIITAMFDQSLEIVPRFVMGKEFTHASYSSWYPAGRTLDCKKSERDMYVKKMQELFNEDQIKFYDTEETMLKIFAGFFSTFTLLRWVIIILVGMIVFLLTYLYQMIFLEEETSDIALLKSMGSKLYTPYLWQFLRIMILLLVSMFIGATGIDFIAGKLIAFGMESQVNVSNFVLIPHFVSNFVMAPVYLVCISGSAVLLSCRKLKDIKIWSIRNE